ncbi:SMI1/KNR4 family protein [Brevundimonas sp.]|uniref:SMI1/KNR4 family protein n=1 Tax=Brevundimonas sp. TaxID=1871086 RepID=UPI002ABAC922|nr:SMI1/KNR4 family protein [Brevundimonas sp.]MDZ4362158.1 SMI1/KNR4 family protein [Brevundimonas sp.]
MGDPHRFILSTPPDHEAHQAAVASLLAGFARNLPPDYIEFLTKWDGGEGFIGNHYVVVHGPALSQGTNAAHAEFGNPIQFLGGDGGGEAIGFDLREGQQFQLVMAPLIGTDDQSSWVPMASSFTDLMAGNFRPEFLEYFSGGEA